MKRILLLAALSAFSVLQAQTPQTPEFDRQSLREDFIYNIDIYSEAYINPVLQTFNYNGASGWQFTAEPLDPGSVRIDFAFQATFKPDPNTEFDFFDLPFTDEITLERTFNDNIPTALGGETDRTFEYTIQDNQGRSYTREIQAWSGADAPFNAITTAVPIVSVGLPRKTELTARIFPYFSYRDVAHSEIGVGLKHEVGQYTSLDSSWAWNVGMFYNMSRFGWEPDKFLDGARQKLELRSDVFMISSMISKRWGNFSAFGGLAIFNYNSTFDIQGEYQYYLPGDDPDLNDPAFAVNNPYTEQSDATTSRLTLGAAVHGWDFIHLATAVNFSDYTTWTINLAFDIDTGDDKPKKSKEDGNSGSGLDRS